MIVIFFVLDEDGALIFIPQNVVIIALLARIDMDEPMINFFFAKSPDHVSAMFVATDIGYEASS